MLTYAGAYGVLLARQEGLALRHRGRLHRAKTDTFGTYGARIGTTCERWHSVPRAPTRSARHVGGPVEHRCSIPTWTARVAAGRRVSRAHPRPARVLPQDV